MIERTETQETIAELRKLANELEKGEACVMQIDVEYGVSKITKSARIVGIRKRATVEWMPAQ